MLRFSASRIPLVCIAVLCTAAMGVTGCSAVDDQAAATTDEDVAQDGVEIASNESALVTDNRIATNKLATNRISGNRLAANRLAANRLAANRLAANRISFNRLAANRISLNRLAANRIALNRLAANRIALNKIAGNRIAFNRLAANRISLNRLAANRIALNELDAHRLASRRLSDGALDTELEARGAFSNIAAEGRPVGLDTTGRLVFDTSGVDSAELERPDLAERGFAELAAQGIAGVERVELDPEVVGSLLTTEDGREVLSYVAGCALTEEQTLVGAFEGTTYEFPGSVGLAPEWTEWELDTTSQRWVSACVFARVNAHGVSVQVSLRGAHPRLQAGAEEMAEWNLEEGAFWGNLFIGDSIDWNSCRGLDQAAGERGALVDRDCTEPDAAHPGVTQCGFKDAGDCGDFAKHAACGGFDASGTYYSGCSDRDSNVTPYGEVVTTYVRADQSH